MIHTTNPVIKHKAGLLNLAEELSNVSKAGQDYETPHPERTDARYFLSIAALLIFLLIPALNSLFCVRIFTTICLIPENRASS